MPEEAKYADAEPGSCSVCGYRGVFRRNHKSIREGYRCERCGASLRYRHQASVVLSKYASAGSSSFADLVEEPEFRDLRVYEPGITGPFRKYFKDHPNYTTSYLWEGVEAGDVKNGVRCENLERSTFDDDSFDLLITSDIFEHVRKPYTAFAEIYRLLKPGGRHVFTVPLSWPLPTSMVSRVDTSGSKDTFLLPAVYHGSPTDPKGSLVYTDFGLDVVEKLGEIGFETEVHKGKMYNVTFCSQKTKVVEGQDGAKCTLSRPRHEEESPRSTRFINRLIPRLSNVKPESILSRLKPFSNIGKSSGSGSAIRRERQQEKKPAPEPAKSGSSAKENKRKLRREGQMGVIQGLEALRRDNPWPSLCHINPFYLSVDGGGRHIVTSLIAEGGVRTMVEIGCFLCGSTLQWLNASPGLTVIGVDPWDGNWAPYLDQLETSGQLRRYAPDLDVPIVREALLQAGNYRVALNNVRDFRDRFIPVRRFSPEAMRYLHSRGIRPDMIYIDAFKEAEDLNMAFELFPNAILCGDDWSWRGPDGVLTMRENVERFAQRRGLTIVAESQTWALQR